MITVDPKALDPERGSAYYWSFYDLRRAAYTAGFAKDYPTEKAYRRRPREEAGALRVVAEILSKDLKEVRLKAADDPSLSNLLRLHPADLLEAYVFVCASRRRHRTRLLSLSPDQPRQAAPLLDGVRR